MSLLNLEVPDTEESVLVERLSRGQLVRRRFFRHKLAVFGLITLGLMFVLVPRTVFQCTNGTTIFLLQPPHVSTISVPPRLVGDALTLHALQMPLTIGLLVAVFATGLAAMVGAFAG